MRRTLWRAIQCKVKRPGDSLCDLGQDDGVRQRPSGSEELSMTACTRLDAVSSSAPGLVETNEQVRERWEKNAHIYMAS